MDKRYQVFVSSTYDDLKAERSKVIQTLMEMDCIPAGMELFPAADEEQLEFIKKVIDDCDYYLLIIGGKYGTTGSDGLSYTEKEYDYAVSRGLKIIALLHENPDDLIEEKTETDPEFKEKLKEFREKVATGRLVKFWTKPDDLPGIVALSISKTIKMSPAIGWVRANQISNEESLAEINELRKENIELKEYIKDLQDESIPNIDNLANMDESIEVSGKYYSSDFNRYYTWNTKVTWRDVFIKISPFILKIPNESVVQTILGRELSKIEGRDGSINDQDFQTIKIQFIALGLIQVQYEKTVKGSMAWFWYLTLQGKKLMTELRTIKSKNSK